MSNRKGMTLVEVMVSSAILTMVVGMLWGVMFSIQNSIHLEDSQIIAHDDTRNAMMMLVKELRQAVGDSISADEFPSNQIQYRVVTDLDGNGWPVDSSGNIEVSPIKTIMQDLDDLNEDGFTSTQLVLTIEGSDTIRVLANDLEPDNGVEFDLMADNAVRVTLTSERPTDPTEKRTLTFSLVETVAPRN